MKIKRYLILSLLILSVLSLTVFAKTHKTVKCPECGELADQWIESATCTSKGYKETMCYECDYYKYQTYSKKSHSYNEIDRVEPTYISDGYIIEQCTMCGGTVKTVLPQLAHVHNWYETSRIEPTQDADGIIYYGCFCGEVITETLPYISPVQPDVVSMGTFLFSNIWRYFGIYVPGFSFTIGQMWIGIVICSVSLLLAKMFFGIGGRAISSHTSSTNKPKIADNRKNDEF